MMNRFQNIINRNTIANIDCVCFKNQTGLIFGKFAPFNMT